jgi:hypothetical protein
MMSLSTICGTHYNASTWTVAHVNTFICSISQCQDLYIIVDQVNALDISEDDGCRAPTLQAIHWLDVLRLN